MMGFTWFCLGVVSFASILFLAKLSKRYRLNEISWGGLIIGISMVLFGIAWAVGSVLEGEPRAASMGILMFGLSGIVLLSFSARYISTKAERLERPGPVTEKGVTEPLPVHEAARPEPSKPLAAAAGSKTETGLGRAIRYAAYLSLVIALIIGMTTGEKDFEGMVVKRFQHEKLTKVNDDPVVFQLGEQADGPGNYILIQEGQGYGGPFVVGVRIMEDAKVHEVMLLDDKETPAFIQKANDARFAEQFIGKHVSDDFIVGIDVDAVSGATISTMAGTEAIRRGAHIAATRHFKIQPEWRKVPWKFGVGEGLILGIFVLAFFPIIYREKPWKHIYMAATIALVGFYLNAAISIGSLSGLVMGYIPGIKDHLIWWTLTAGTVVGVIILGKNVYCYRICPFYGIQFLLNKVSGSRLSLAPALVKRSRFIANFFLWLALMAIFLSSHPALGAYEPFAMMFSLEGIGVQWYILPMALIGSFFMSTFWCRFFCPVGHGLRNLIQFRKKALDVFKEESDGCRNQ